MLRWLAVAAIVLCPLLVSELATRVLFHSSPDQFVASFPNDLPEYWHEVATFREAGFQGGYYAAREIPPRASAVHFGVHGPVSAVIYGSLAKIFGWGPATGVYFNVAFLMVAMAFFVGVGRIDGIQIPLTLLAVWSFWSVHVHALTSFPESFNQSLAIILATLAYRRYGRESGTRPPAAILAAILALLSILRFSWVLFWVPFFLIEARRRQKRWILGPLVLALAVAATLMRFALWISAPGFNSVTSALGMVRQDFSTGITEVAVKLMINATTYFIASPADRALRLQMAMLAFGVPLIYGVTKLVGMNDLPCARRGLTGFFPEAWFHCYNAMSILLAGLVLYLPAGYFRVFSSHVAVSLFTLILRGRVWAVYILVAANLAVLWAVPSAFSDVAQNFSVDHAHLSELRGTLNQVMRYDPGARTAWCNTVLTDTDSYDHRVAQIPPGFGISYFRPAEPPDAPLKSRFLLLSEHGVHALKGRGAVRPLATLPGEDLTLYVNASARCDEFEGLATNGSPRVEPRR